MLRNRLKLKLLETDKQKWMLCKMHGWRQFVLV